MKGLYTCIGHLASSSSKVYCDRARPRRALPCTTGFESRTSRSVDQTNPRAIRLDQILSYTSNKLVQFPFVGVTSNHLDALCSVSTLAAKPGSMKDTVYYLYSQRKCDNCDQ
jgi:hypothetical protein